MKTLMVIEELHSYEWVLWVDADALFVNMTERVEHWIQIANKNRADILVAKDIDEEHPFNAGVMLVRNSAWAHRFFRDSVEQLVKRPVTSAVEDQPVFYQALRANLHQVGLIVAVHSPRGA